MNKRAFAANPGLRRNLIVALSLILSLTGCWKKSGEAVVIGKGYNAASEIVDQSQDDKGASPKERRTSPEQWVVKVEMKDDGRKIDVQVDQPRWDAAKVGDRVKVTYLQGRYTGIVWSSKIK